MHFWIDKRSQCAYTGHHRVPSSLSSGVGRLGPGVGVRKGMAAPVHYYPTDYPPRRPRAHRNRSRYDTQPPAVHASRRQAEEPSIYVEIPPEPPQPTIASLAAARSVTPDTLLRTAALGLHHRPPSSDFQQHCGLLVSLAFAALFVAWVVFYFDDHQVYNKLFHSEGTAVWATLAGMCGVGCVLSMFRSKPAPLHTPVRVSSTAQRNHPHVSAPPTDPSPSDEISLSTLLQGGQSSSPEAPPPYHIAVLLPPREEPQASPPAYNDIS